MTLIIVLDEEVPVPCRCRRWPTLSTTEHLAPYITFMLRFWRLRDDIPHTERDVTAGGNCYLVVVPALRDAAVHSCAGEHLLHKDSRERHLCRRRGGGVCNVPSEVGRHPNSHIRRPTNNLEVEWPVECISALLSHCEYLGSMGRQILYLQL